MKKFEIIYKDLFEKINKNELRAGDKIPTEYQLMAKYGVSRTTVIKAVKLLEKNQLIFRERKTGTFVSYTEKYKNVKNNLIVALVFPYIEYNTQLLSGIQDYALENACMVSCYDSENSLKRERKLLLQLLELNISGLIFWPCSFFSNLDVISKLLVKGIKITFIDRRVPGLAGSLVASDNYDSMYNLVNYIVTQGHKKIGYCPVSNNMIQTESARFEGFCNALSDNCLEFDYDYSLRYNFDIRHRFSSENTSDRQDEIFGEVAEKMLEHYKSINNKPTCICCSNDIIAIKVINAFKKAGIAVPEEVSITGFDNLALAKEYSLTTIAQSFYELGKRACEDVISQCFGEKEKTSLIKTDLIRRNTVKNMIK